MGRIDAGVDHRDDDAGAVDAARVHAVGADLLHGVIEGDCADAVELDALDIGARRQRGEPSGVTCAAKPCTVG
jgi:hypothetical protein